MEVDDSEQKYYIDDWYCTLCGGPFHGVSHDYPYSDPMHSYDTQVISPQETEWTQAMYIVGRWPPGPSDMLYAH